MEQKNTPELWDEIWQPTTIEEEEYRIKKEENSIQWQRIEKNVFKKFGTFKGIKTIEIGAGSGTNSLLFAKRGAKVTLLDYSKKALERSKLFFERRGIKVKLVLCDALNLKKKLMEKYDVAMSFGTAEHFKGTDRLKIMRAHFDVLKKGGISFICLPNKMNLPYLLWKFLSQITGRWKWGIELSFSRTELKKIMKKLGKEYHLIGDNLAESFEVINPLRLVKRALKIKKDYNLNKIKKQKGTFLDEYLSPYLTVIGTN